MKYIKRFIFVICGIILIPFTLLFWMIIWILLALLIITAIVWYPFVGNVTPLEWILDHFDYPAQILMRLQDFFEGD